MALPGLLGQQKHYETLKATQTEKDDLLSMSTIDAVLFFTLYGWKQKDIFL